MKLSVSKRNQLIQNIDLSQEVSTFIDSETIFLIGRSKECHIVLDDKQISREHSKIIYKNGQWSIVMISEDAQPLILNGEKILRSEIVQGDTISIGQFQINISELIIKNETIEFANPLTSPSEIIPEAINIKKNEVIIQPIAVKEPVRPEFNDATKEMNLSDLAKDTPPVEQEQNLDQHNDVNENDASENQEEVVEDNFDFGDGQKEEEGFSDIVDVELEPKEENLMADSASNSAYSLENIDTADNEDSTKVMQSFASAFLELFGETAPYDKFILEAPKTYIGRDPAKCQIVLNDPEVSSVHAVIIKNNISITLEDLNSANGTILKGDRINKTLLGHNDEFVIGGVTFTLKIRSEFLKDEHERLMPVDEDQSVEIEEIIEVEAEEGEHVNALGDIESEAPQEKSFLKRIWKNPEQRKKLIIGMVGLVALSLFLPDDKPDAGKDSKNKAKSEKGKDKKGKDDNSKKAKSTLTEEQQRKFSEVFQIGKNHFDSGRYREALEQFDQIASADPYFNPSLQTLISSSKEGLKKLEEAERARLDAIAKAERDAKIKEYLVKAQKYTEAHDAEEAGVWFEKIIKLDPENMKVSGMKRELEAFDREKKRKELEETQKRKEREAKVEKLKPGKNLFIQQEWYKAVGKLDEFLKISGMDEDLIKEAAEMSKKARDKLTEGVSPLIGKAKSLQEGQDLKGAYEIYQQILKIDPSNTEALNQTNEIKEQLTLKARKIYREAIISESLSLFQDAKEKFQEVQQISPIDSDYYKKASDKLKDYLE